MANATKQSQTRESKQKTSFDTLREEFRDVKIQNHNMEVRLAKLESTLKDLIQSIRIAANPHPIEPEHETLDQYINKHVLNMEAQNMEPVDIEGVNTNWHYFVAKKGGFNEVLYMTVQDFLNLPEEPLQFLSFLLQKRDKEVQERLEHLKTEYQKLQGHQLQRHFRELWELHHNFLEKKLLRTWKEEIFLEAFDAFISWLQH